MPLCLSLPTTADLAAPTADRPTAETDAFSALLAALGAGVVPVALPTQLQPEQLPETPAQQPVATAPAAWATATQRGVLPTPADVSEQPTTDPQPVRRPGAGHVPPVESHDASGATPATPATAATPATPAMPAVPTTPALPAIPAVPAIPASATAPATAATRAAPAAPAAPAADATPGLPDRHSSHADETAAVHQPHPEPTPARPAPVDAAVPTQPDRPVEPAVTPMAPSAAMPAAQPLDARERVSSTHHVQPSILEAARGLRHEGGGRTSLVIRLDPPELGAVLVRLTVLDGRVDVQLRTPDLAARSDLQAQSYDVRQVLREQGLDLASFDVAHGEVFTGDKHEAGTPDRGTPRRSQHADGASHVTDDVPDPRPAGTWL